MPDSFCYVYVLRNSNNRLYIGSTNNLKRRIEEHRKKKVFSTKDFKDFDLVYYEAYSFEKNARMREKRLKYFGKAYQELKKRIYPAPSCEEVSKEGRKVRGVGGLNI
ncbi:MAG: GIY-YIG nuclease family protein [Candidatus Omnitrophica bacterium]|nr:GIY-YIG nuclease family protein [Candidatus Omnitrophota bacterium]